MSFKNISSSRVKQSIGKLTHRINIQKRDQEFKISGHQNTFITMFSVWADLETKSGIVKFNGVNIEEIPTHIWKVRTIKSLTSEYFISYNCNRYKIINVEQINERNLGFTLIYSRLLGEEKQAGSESWLK